MRVKTSQHETLSDQFIFTQSKNRTQKKKIIPAKEENHWNKQHLGTRGKSRVVPNDPLFTLC